MCAQGLSRRRFLAITGAATIGAAGLGRAPGRAAMAESYELIDIGITSPHRELNLSFNDMNTHGVIVGNMYIDAEKNSPWVFRDGKLTRIKTGRYGARCSCINDHGVMGGRELLGWHTEDQPFGRPVLWIDGEKEVLPYPDGLPGPAEEGIIRDINNAGTAVGTVSIAGGATYPVVWRDGVPELVPTPAGTGVGAAISINNQGTIVGDWTFEGEGGLFVFDFFGPMEVSFDRSLGYTRVQIAGIDEAGRLLGRVQIGEELIAAYMPDPFADPLLLPQVQEGQTVAHASGSDGGSIFVGGFTVDGKDQAAIWNDGVASALKTVVRNTRGLRLAGAYRITPDGVIGGNAVDRDGAWHAYQLIPAS